MILCLLLLEKKILNILGRNVLQIECYNGDRKYTDLKAEATYRIYCIKLLCQIKAKLRKKVNAYYLSLPKTFLRNSELQKIKLNTDF